MSALAAVKTVELRCPECGRFLAEASAYGRAVCRECGWEIEVRSKELRQAAERYPRGGSV